MGAFEAIMSAIFRHLMARTSYRLILYKETFRRRITSFIYTKAVDKGFYIRVIRAFKRVFYFSIIFIAFFL